MNPHYSSAGKKKLSNNLWEKMTEIFIDEICLKEEVREIIKRGLPGFEIDSICEFYVNIMKLHKNGDIWNGT